MEPDGNRVAIPDYPPSRYFYNQEPLRGQYRIIS